MKARVVVITGCSSGFGLEMTQQFLENGDQVIATMRDAHSRVSILAKLRERYAEQITVFDLDVTKADQREKLGDLIEKKFSGRCDVLVNNAGYGIFGSLEDTSEEQLRAVMEVNFFGSALVTKTLLPFLRKSKGAVFNISSLMGRSSLPLGGVYSASKYAMEGLCEGLYYEGKIFGVRFCTIQPGGHRTKFISSLVWAQEALSEKSAYLVLTKGLQKMMARLSSRTKAPGASKVAKIVVKLSHKKRIPRAVTVGGDAFFVKILQALLPFDTYQRLTRKVYLRFLTRLGHE